MFESGALTVSENDSFVEACVSLSHINLQRSIVVSVGTQPSTATSKRLLHVLGIAMMYASFHRCHGFHPTINTDRIWEWYIRERVSSSASYG